MQGFAFAVANSNYMKYDWTKITTLVVFSAAVNDTLMCYAHSKGARITYGGKVLFKTEEYKFDIKQLTRHKCRP